ncbi:hypothetical protein GCM10009069_26120 [Algimonas arctica]|uniref:Uncharacterized protein n=1 Tax=Algimonas arctica TaxID=1479486 RepID=A0A8J3CSC0_9PROT|nr:DUF6796 family protein [Algimonas arctica]GHB02110.1 hypothetical protein GCM10009069_26120 [Algimonas arctica]
MAHNPSETHWIRLAGWAGLLGALLVGVGEFSMQFTPRGGIEDMTSYLYFNDISATRLSFGHFTAVLSAPLYLLGYYFLSKQLEPAGRLQSKLFFLIGAYAFALGTAWIGQRFFIASTVHEIANGQALSGLLSLFSEHNEPFVNVLRLAMLLVSGLWIKLILTGRTHLPKWMAVFSPIVLLAVMAGLYFFKTKIGLYVFPVAMNATHFIVFGLALLTTRPPKALT